MCDSVGTGRIYKEQSLTQILKSIDYISVEISDHIIATMMHCKHGRLRPNVTCTT